MTLKKQVLIISSGIGIYMQGRPVEQFIHHAGRTGMSDDTVQRTFTSESFSVPQLTKHAEDWYSLFNSLGQCHRLYIHRFHSMDYFLEFYRTVTGEKIDAAGLLRRGERAWNMQKQLNVRLGFGREHDAAPDLWFEPMKSGPKEQPMMDYYKREIITRTRTEEMLDEYYAARGWDRETGFPLPEQLEALDLNDFAV